VTEGLFRSDSFGFQPEFLARLAADPLESDGERSFSLPARVLNVQSQVLDRLMSDGVATRLLDSSFKVAPRTRASRSRISTTRCRLDLERPQGRLATSRSCAATSSASTCAG
jgi:hypothetical protein